MSRPYEHATTHSCASDVRWSDSRAVPAKDNRPPNHLVPHAADDRYIDRNHGGVPILQDRLLAGADPRPG